MSTSQVSTLEQPAPAGRRGAAHVATPGIAPVTAKVNGHDVALSGKKAQVLIHPADGPGGDEPQPVGLNGFVYQIPRGTPCEIPVECLDILRNAVTQVVSTDATGAQIVREVPRFAFTVSSIDA